MREKQKYPRGTTPSGKAVGRWSGSGNPRASVSKERAGATPPFCSTPTGKVKPSPGGTYPPKKTKEFLIASHSSSTRRRQRWRPSAKAKRLNFGESAAVELESTRWRAQHPRRRRPVNILRRRGHREFVDPPRGSRGGVAHAVAEGKREALFFLAQRYTARTQAGEKNQRRRGLGSALRVCLLIPVPERKWLDCEAHPFL